MEKVEDGPAPPSFEAEYALESPLKCPHCKGTIQALQALRLAGKVPFFANVINFSAKGFTSFAFSIVVEIVSC